MKSTFAVPLQSQQPASSRSDAEEELLTGGSFWNVAFISSLAGLFILYSRFFDVAATGFKIPRIVLSLMVLFFLLSGRMPLFLRSTVGKLVLVMFAWVSVTLFTSIWKGGSIPEIYQLMQSVLIFVVAASLPITLRNVKRMMSTLAVAGLVAALLSIPFGATEFGRLALKSGSYWDPNYYAMSLVIIVPFFWAMAAGESFFLKIFAWLSLMPVFWAIAKSGSRGAMLAAVVMLVLMFFISSGGTKMLLIVATVGGVLIAVVALPDYLRTRYLTFFQVDEKSVHVDSKIGDSAVSEQDRLQADSNSALDRKQLLYTSIALTIEHPLFGVGPGNFPTAVYNESKAAGIVHNQWLVTHNSYTQISSETGVLGLLLYLGIIFTSFKCIISVLKRSKESGEQPDAEAYTTAKYLFLSMAALCVVVFFLAVGYEITIYLWAGLAVSLQRTVFARTAATEDMEEQLAAPVLPKAIHSPAYAKAATPTPQRETPTVSGRPVRFNRFR